MQQHRHEGDDVNLNERPSLQNDVMQQHRHEGDDVNLNERPSLQNFFCKKYSIIISCLLFIYS